MNRAEKVMNGAALWGAFYRANPEKFVEDYLHIRLKRFQKIVLVMMFWSNVFVFIACRGQCFARPLNPLNCWNILRAAIATA